MISIGADDDWVTSSLIERLGKLTRNGEPLVQSIPRGHRPSFSDSKGNEFQPIGIVIGSWVMPEYNPLRMYDSTFYVNDVHTSYEVLMGRNTIAKVGILRFSRANRPVLPLISKPVTRGKCSPASASSHSSLRCLLATDLQAKINQGIAMQQELIRKEAAWRAKLEHDDDDTQSVRSITSSPVSKLGGLKGRQG